MKKSIIFIILGLFFSATISAQSAEKVTQMLESQTINLESVAYFASTYLGIASDATEDAVALSNLEEYVTYPKITKNRDNLSYADFAYFCIETWNIPGGIMLSITNAPRYAFRELQAMGFISSSTNPNAKISGVEALTIMMQCIDYSVENETINLASFSK